MKYEKNEERHKDTSPPDLFVALGVSTVGLHTFVSTDAFVRFSVAPVTLGMFVTKTC